MSDPGNTTVVSGHNVVASRKTGTNALGAAPVTFCKHFAMQTARSAHDVFRHEGHDSADLWHGMAFVSAAAGPTSTLWATTSP